MTWGHEFLVENMTMTFVNNDYAKHREDVLFDREMALMPQAMPFAEIHKRIRDVTQERQVLRMDLVQLRRQHRRSGIGLNIRQLVRDTMDEEETASYDQLAVAIAAETIKLKIKRADMFLRRLQARNEVGAAEVAQGDVVRGCPASDCRGFLNAQWRCGMCKSQTCSKCHAILADALDAHVCEEDDVKTAEMLMNDTKSCPKCATPIFKVDGCDQIWCTQCHVAFSWHTGQIETGRIHNPHYYEYLRRKNGGTVAREMGDIPCGGLPTVYETTQFLNAVYKGTKPEDVYHKTRITSVVVVADTILRDLIPAYVYDATRNIDANRDLRVAYLCNELDKIELKKTLRRREKTRLKHTDLAHVLNAFVLVVADILQNMTVPDAMTDEIMALADASSQIDEVVAFTDAALAKIAACYSATRLSVGDRAFQYMSAAGRLI
jgi:hypothetical protein